MSLLNLLFPEKCLLCRKVLARNELDLCLACRADSPEYPDKRGKLPFLDSYTAIWYYEGPVRASLLRYKFRGCRSYAEGYGRLLAMKLLGCDRADFDVITWVPISPLRKFRRGYDQSQLLAQAVSRQIQIPAVPLLRKVRHNRPQSGISGDAHRRANVLGVYALNRKFQPAGKRILLLDDIVTTGATAGECARVLLTAGAKEVHLAAVAKARDQGKNNAK